MKLLFDTNIIIEALRQGKKATDILNRFEQTDHQLCISSIVIFELFSGRSTRNKAQVKDIWNFLDFFEIIDVDKKIAQRAGEIFRDYVSDIDISDFIIAATAIEIEASIVTLNIKHFEKIPGVSIYKW